LQSFFGARLAVGRPVGCTAALPAQILQQLCTRAYCRTRREGTKKESREGSGQYRREFCEIWRADSIIGFRDLELQIMQVGRRPEERWPVEERWVFSVY